MTATVTHAALLSRADRVWAAASDHDVDRMRLEVGALLDSLVAHIDEERPHVRHLPTFSARLVERGQERLLAGLVALLVETEGEDACRCESLSGELMVQLFVQADAERRAFTRSGSASHLPSDR